MFTKNWKNLVALSAVVALTLSLAAGSAQAVTIIEDSFSGTANALLDGNAPDVTNLPGGVWVHGGFGGHGPGHARYDGAGHITTALQDNSTTTTGDLSSYSELTVTTVIAPQATTNHGVGAGFFATQGDGNVNAAYSFYGFVLRADGRVGYYASPWGGGDLNSHSADLTVNWSGPAFVATDYYTLSYTIDTATDQVTAVSLSGSTADYSPFVASGLTPFTDTNTQYLGVHRIHSGVGGTGSLDNLLLTGAAEAVPEPSTLVLLSTGLLGLLACGRRRKRRRA